MTLAAGRRLRIRALYVGLAIGATWAIWAIWVIWAVDAVCSIGVLSVEDVIGTWCQVVVVL